MMGLRAESASAGFLCATWCGRVLHGPVAFIVGGQDGLLDEDGLVGLVVVKYGPVVGQDGPLVEHGLGQRRRCSRRVARQDGVASRMARGARGKIETRRRLLDVPGLCPPL